MKKIIITESQLENVIIEMAYPASFNMDEFKNISTFSGRVRYCDQKLRKISSGSGRVVYQIDDEKVLKLAKNSKGIAQNEVESESFIQQYGVVAKVFDTDDNGTFVEMELANKVTPTIFRNIVGFDFRLLEPYLWNQFIAGNRQPKKSIAQENTELLNNNEWVNELSDLVGSYDMPIGDVSRLNSYGIVKRDGSDSIVLIDFGLTNSVYDEYYR